MFASFHSNGSIPSSNDKLNTVASGMLICSIISNSNLQESHSLQVERSGSGVELWTINHENLGLNPDSCVKTLGKFFHSTLLQFTQLNK